MPNKCCTDMEKSFVIYINFYYSSLLNQLNTRQKELARLNDELARLKEEEDAKSEYGTKSEGEGG